MRKILLVAAAMAIAPLLFSPSAGAQELGLYGGGHFQGSGQPIAEAFTAKTGIATSYTRGNTGAGGFARRQEAGEVIDVVVLNVDDMAMQVEAGLIKPDSVALFARDGLALGLPKGAPKPDISTPDRFRDVLLAARAVGIVGPDADRPYRGRNEFEILTNLGIRDEVTITNLTVANRSAALVDGTVDIGFWPHAELVAHDEVDVLGPVPAELNIYREMAVGIPTRNRNDTDARALIEFLTSPEAEAVYRPRGLDPMPAGTP